VPIRTRYFLVVSMDVPADKETLFNEVYDRTPDAGDEPRYSVTYEIESPAVLLGAEWAAAGERGRWPTEVRPFTTNRRHVLRKVIG
jgi:hypothetical protein